MQANDSRFYQKLFAMLIYKKKVPPSDDVMDYDVITWFENT